MGEWTVFGRSRTARDDRQLRLKSPKSVLLRTSHSSFLSSLQNTTGWELDRAEPATDCSNVGMLLPKPSCEYLQDGTKSQTQDEKVRLASQKGRNIRIHGQSTPGEASPRTRRGCRACGPYSATPPRCGAVARSACSDCFQSPRRQRTCLRIGLTWGSSLSTVVL